MFIIRTGEVICDVGDVGEAEVQRLSDLSHKTDITGEDVDADLPTPPPPPPRTTSDASQSSSGSFLKVSGVDLLRGIARREANRSKRTHRRP